MEKSHGSHYISGRQSSLRLIRSRFVGLSPLFSPTQKVFQIASDFYSAQMRQSSRQQLSHVQYFMQYIIHSVFWDACCLSYRQSVNTIWLMGCEQQCKKIMFQYRICKNISFIPNRTRSWNYLGFEKLSWDQTFLDNK